MSSVNAKVVPFDEALTFTRASTGTYFDKDGVLRTAQVDEPRFDHDPVTGGLRGLLNEPSATNLLDYCNDAAQWTQGSLGTLTPDTSLGLDGVTNAHLNVPGDTAGESKSIIGHGVSFGSPNRTVGEDYTFYAIVKKAGADWVALSFDNGGGYRASAKLQLSTGFTHTRGHSAAASNMEASVTPLGGEWFLVSLSYHWEGGGGAHRICASSQEPSNGAVDHEIYGDGASGVEVWFAQVEKGRKATSPVWTSGAPVTRSADDPRRVLGSEFNPQSGTLLVEFEWPEAPGGNSGYVLTLHQGGGSNGQRGLHCNGDNASMNINVVSDSYATVSFAEKSPGDITKAALYYSDGASTYRAAVDGTVGNEATATGGGISPVEILIGNYGYGGGRHYTGHIKRVEYIPGPKTVAELEALTA